jgi:molybdate transport system substrate-binding protein
MSAEVTIISSMATRRLLADLAAAYQQANPATRISIESIGGVDAAKRIAAGEAFDIVVLASGPIDKLIAQGHITGGRIDLVNSSIAVAGKSGAAHPSIATEDDVKRAALAASTVGYSTGPSGDQLMALFARWGIADRMKDRLVQARPGVPVGTLVASGEAALGFQQLSEFTNVAGIDVIGLLPASIQGVTTFSGGVVAVSSQPDRARAVLEYMASPDLDALKRQHGMDAANRSHS